MKQQMIVGCPSCKQHAPMRHLHSTAYGIEGTHMAGSERFVCENCQHTLSREEAEARNLVYVLDKE